MERNNPFYHLKKGCVEGEINLRHLTVSEALPLLDKYLDDAFLAGRPMVRVIHGRHGGILRREVREYLDQHPHVKSWRPADIFEGGLGVTVVYLYEI
ncbi:MAG: Smr/MutS family protein [bacterium]|nr:Smr/MutS family protein [bacterium]